MPNPLHTRPCKVIAHRGNSADAPENSLIAFKEAIKLNVDFLECDVQLTKDNIPVVMHDKTFHRITAKRRRHDVDQMTLEEISKIDIGSWLGEKFSDQRILTLKEFLTIPKGPIGMMLDIKEETVTERELAHVVGDVIKKVKTPGIVLAGSLNPAILLCLEAYLPQQLFIPIIKEISMFNQFKPLRAKHFAIHYSIASRELIQELHQMGAQVWAWTVDDKTSALDLIHRGIDGLITNIPKKILSLHP